MIKDAEKEKTLMSELFNSFLFNSVPPELQSMVEKGTHIIAPQMLRYKVMPRSSLDTTPSTPRPKLLPSTFDPRFPHTIPPGDVDEWFYKNSDGKLIPIIVDDVLEQDGCGSCWAFSTTSIFSDAA